MDIVLLWGLVTFFSIHISAFRAWTLIFKCLFEFYYSCQAEKKILNFFLHAEFSKEKISHVHNAALFFKITKIDGKKNIIIITFFIQANSVIVFYYNSKLNYWINFSSTIKKIQLLKITFKIKNFLTMKKSKKLLQLFKVKIQIV